MTSISRTTSTRPHAAKPSDGIRRIGSSVLAPLRRLRSVMSTAIARDQLGPINEIEVGRETGARI